MIRSSQKERGARPITLAAFVDKDDKPPVGTGAWAGLDTSVRQQILSYLLDESPGAEMNISLWEKPSRSISRS
jgi:hypothetical protein